MYKENSDFYNEVFSSAAERIDPELLPAKLYLIPTPIGNIGDISLRALIILNDVQEIYCEDTRNSHQLLNILHISKPLISCHQHNEMQRAEEICKKVVSGMAIAYVSDAGTPGVSDPGERLIKYFIRENAPFEVLPGANAVLPAWVMSGLSTDKLFFCGFLPRSGSERTNMIEQIRKIKATTVIYESPLRVGATLKELYEKLGNRSAALARELTKYHEEVVRKDLCTLAEIYSEVPPKGECIIVVSEGEEVSQDNEQAEKLIRMLLDAQCKTSDIARIASATLGISKNKMYKLATKLDEESKSQ